jgi:WhiB family redox-sensing transcriptional regulator
VGFIALVDSSNFRFPMFYDKGVAPCATADPEAFFPEREKGSPHSEIRMAKTICRSCPYKQECLEWAVSNSETGIWGGTTAQERRALRRSKGKIAS